MTELRFLAVNGSACGVGFLRDFTLIFMLLIIIVARHVFLELRYLLRELLHVRVLLFYELLKVLYLFVNHIEERCRVGWRIHIQLLDLFD